MDIIHSVADLRARLQREPNNVFVPTMGNLHDGHLSLLAEAQRRQIAAPAALTLQRGSLHTLEKNDAQTDCALS